MEGNNNNDGGEMKLKRRNMPTVKQFEYAEIVVEFSENYRKEEKSSSEFMTYLLSLLSEKLKEQIYEKYYNDYQNFYRPYVMRDRNFIYTNIYAKTVKKRKISKRFQKPEKNEDEDSEDETDEKVCNNEELDEVKIFRAKPATSISEFESFVENNGVILNISEQRISIKTPIKKKAPKKGLKWKSRRSKVVYLEEGEDVLSEDDEPEDSDSEGVSVERSLDFSLEDFIVQKSVGTKKKVKTRRANYCAEAEDKPRPILLPLNQMPEVDEAAWGELGEVEEVEEVKEVEERDEEMVRVRRLRSFSVPAGWRVSYSQTEPTVCEVWSGHASVLFMKTSEDKVNMRVTPTPDFPPESEDLYDICRSLEVLKISCSDVQRDVETGVEVYHSDVAHRHLLSAPGLEDTGSLVEPSLMSDYDPALMLLCDICLEPCPCHPLTPPCGHTYCSPCWRTWLSSPGGEGGSCPAPGCPTVLDTTALHWVAGPGLYTHLVAGRLERLVVRQPWLHSCPRPGCGKVARRTVTSQTVISCQCGHTYCCLCSQEDHSPASCQDLLTFNTFTAKSAQYAKMEAVVEVRACPGCGAAWEKLYGCNHMSCPCGSHFCWGCGRPARTHRGGMCGNMIIPLQKRNIEYLPTEVLEIKRIEMFKLFAKFNGKPKDLLPLTFSQASEQEIWSQVLRYRNCLRTIMYALLCNNSSKLNLTKARRGISSLIGLSELLHHPHPQRPQQPQWREKIRNMMRNIEPLYQLSVNFQEQKT